MIRHTVVFKLVHERGSAAEQNFLNIANQLQTIPGVEKFECLRQVSAKNTFTFGLSMEFKSQVEYDGYNNHDLHQAFVNDVWIPQVEDFMEIDYEVLAL